LRKPYHACLITSDNCCEQSWTLHQNCNIHPHKNRPIVAEKRAALV
jgi:hypothetical protein